MQSSACERCHRRKVRCDRKDPACSPCVRANVACEYAASEHQVRRRNIQQLKRRIEALERENASLASRARRHDSESPRSGTEASRNGTEPSRSGTVAEQVMHMSLIAGGSDHFVGSASGILLANLLQTCQEPAATVGSSSAQWNANPSPSVQPSELLPARPPKNLARHLIQAYCNHDYLCYPFSSLDRLQHSFDAVYDQGTASTAPDGFFVDMVLAIGTAQVHKYNWNGVYDAEVHYNRAMTKLGEVMAEGGIERLQALLLVCQYRMGSTSRNTTASVWHLIGVAARMCLEMGLHRAATYAASEGQVEALEGLEVKQRCFWSLVAIDRIASIALGRPLAIQLEDIDVDLPDVSRPGLLHSYPTPTSPLDTPDQLESTAVFVHIVKYRIICGKVLNALYRNTRRPPQESAAAAASSPSPEQRRQDLTEELQAWHGDTALLSLLGRDVESSKTSSFASREWYSLLYHNALLMLYRPSPCLCDASRSSATLQRIYDSAREAIHLYASLHRSRTLNYSWITMHSVFNAGLSYIYALRNHVQAVQSCVAAQGTTSAIASTARLSPDPAVHQVVNDTRSCSKVLVAVAERWDAAKDCSDLFDRLSDAVLSDVFEASRAPAGDGARGGGAASDNPPVDLSSSYYDVDAGTQYAHIQVDDTFRDCFGDLRDMALDEYHNDTLSQLSQEWFLGLGDGFLPPSGGSTNE